MNAKRWLFLFALEIAFLFIGIVAVTVFVDPYFHYHKPINNLYYCLDNQRSQNDGIIKRFEYDSIITGTSMTENFKTSEFNKIFNANAIKVCFSGGSYKEVNDNLKKAFESKKQIKYVLRCLDYNKFFQDKDTMREDLGEYPVYLYDNNLFNDVKYIFNKKVIFNMDLPMIINAYFYNENGGITSFDEYSNWNDEVTFGKDSVLGERKEYIKNEEKVLTLDEKKTIEANINQNVIELADKHPETTFYYFFPPYSIAYWGELYENGTLNRQIDAERVVIEQILKCKNIKLYSFNDQWGITTYFDNYKDELHYGEWINTEILYMIHNNIGRLTEENYEFYLDKERKFYGNYDYRFYE